jgi:hypothetical protein
MMAQVASFLSEMKTLDERCHWVTKALVSLRDAVSLVQMIFEGFITNLPLVQFPRGRPRRICKSSALSNQQSKSRLSLFRCEG